MGGGGAKVTGRRESLVLFKTFNNFCSKVSNYTINKPRRNVEKLAIHFNY
jgi:hypothetical protein